MGTRVVPSQIRNKIKREDVHRKQKREKKQGKLKRRLAQAESEQHDPAAKKVWAKLMYSIQLPDSGDSDV